MKIAVVGGTFWDIFVFGEKPHSSIIKESPGGSGLNVAYGLFLLGHTVDFYSNIGDDWRGKQIIEILERASFDISHMFTIQGGKTGIFIAQDDRPIAVDPGVNRREMKLSSLSEYDIVFVTGEVSEKTIRKICENARNVILDVGPGARFDTTNLNALVIGNEHECSFRRCDVVKMDSKGARWGEVYVPGNGIPYTHSIGLGDLFDIVFVHNLLLGKSKKEILEEAVKCSQTLGQKENVTPFERISLLESLSAKDDTLKSPGESKDASHHGD
ncbi:PfkB family carbohydrate kinase [Thermotoga sp. 38H-to]|uniref:PfkB family carbohydrate kinase n=1 Tax=Thermotoga sp. 38H-to TaxID=1755812 RepID=UPI0013ED37ED|nr:PfkB family carbohydrate kinase [Thermotoga sp. 38H-to]KAF2959729.1 carbohydrate kinase [Thermotoga sp. 38H-to]